jgi:hypothetical protein
VVLLHCPHGFVWLVFSGYSWSSQDGCYISKPLFFTKLFQRLEGEGKGNLLNPFGRAKKTFPDSPWIFSCITLGRIASHALSK